MQQAQFAPDMVMISGASGVGKSTTIERYKVIAPNVWCLTGEPCFSTPRMVLDCLAQALGITERYSSQSVSRAIVAHMKGTNGLLIIDEAQHLSPASLDQMRTLHDLAKIGLALIGSETLARKFQEFARDTHFAQLSSRIGMRLVRLKPTRVDLEMVIDAWGIEGRELRHMLVDRRCAGPDRPIDRIAPVADQWCEGEPGYAAAGRERER